MSDLHAAQLFDEASAAGLRITGLDGWTQTRLAGSLKLRREVVNAIINRDPVAEPSDTRPRMVEACRKIIAFAAVISRKDDAVVPVDVDPAHSFDDDAQAYETHKLRLRRLVEEAIGGGAFIEGMYRVGELSSQAVHAPSRFRVQMIGNVVTAIQRLLDKPQSRSIPVDLVSHNLRRLTLAEWAARRVARQMPGGEDRTKAADNVAYIRGQVGYAMIFSGLLGQNAKALGRGRRRLWRAVRVQPGTDCGHWSNLLRAINDLLANGHEAARDWAGAVVALAEKQHHPGFGAAFTRLRDNGEIATLLKFWETCGLTCRVTAAANGAPVSARTKPAAPRRKARKGATAAAILLLVGLLISPSAARAGDGKELQKASPSQRAVAPAAFPSRPSAAAFNSGGGGSIAPGSSARGAAGYGARYSDAALQRAALYPARQSAVARAAAAADGPAENRFAQRQRLGRARPVQRLEADQDIPTIELDLSDADLKEFEQDLLSAIRTVREIERPREQAAPAPARPTHSDAPVRSSSNRRFPLILRRDVQPEVRTRTIPRAAAKKADKAPTAPAESTAAPDDARADISPAAN